MLARPAHVGAPAFFKIRTRLIAANRRHALVAFASFGPIPDRKSRFNNTLRRFSEARPPQIPCEAAMKLFLILGVILLASASNAQAIDCSTSLPAARSGYWSYRIIDGRKCWFEGRSTIPKSSLRWAKRSFSDAHAKMPAANRPEFTDPEDGSCCWPPLSNSDNFDSRWRALFRLGVESVN